MPSRSSHPVYCGGGCGMWGHRRSLCAVCVVVVGVAHWVVVVVFTWAAWGRGHRQCAVCVAVAVFVPCVLWLWVWCVGSRSLCHMCRGCRCAASSHSCRCRPCATCIVVVTFALHVVLLLPFLHHMWCCWCLHCVGCGVAAVVIMLCVVYVAARGAVMGQPGGIRRHGTCSWEGHDEVGACLHCRCGW